MNTVTSLPFVTELENAACLIGAAVQKPIRVLLLWLVCEAARRLEVIFSVQMCSLPCRGGNAAVWNRELFKSL